jgi:hypothetical protein
MDIIENLILSKPKIYSNRVQQNSKTSEYLFLHVKDSSVNKGKEHIESFFRGFKDIQIFFRQRN